jgi:hypothetical protein
MAFNLTSIRWQVTDRPQIADGIIFLDDLQVHSLFSGEGFQLLADIGHFTLCLSFH